MNLTKLAGVVAATAITFGVGAIGIAPAWATDNIKPFGDPVRIVDKGGNAMIAYLAKDLNPSSDDVAHNGQLYEATLIVQAYGVPADPRVTNFGARAESGEFYPMIAGAPGGIDGAQLAPDTSVTGKLYFDVVGPVPNSVVWNDGMRDIIAWVPGASNGGILP